MGSDDIDRRDDISYYGLSISERLSRSDSLRYKRW